MTILAEFFCVPWGIDFTRQYCVISPQNFGRGSGSLSSLGSIVFSLMPYVLAISGLILLFMIVASGYTLLTSAGNPEAIGKAKSRLTAAVAGFIIVFAAFWIYQLVGLLLATSFAP